MRILKSHPLSKLANCYIIDSPQPSNLSYLWNFGSLLAFYLIAQIVTGVTLAMQYNPSVQEAFNSIYYIIVDLNNGWLIRYLHSNIIISIIFIVYLHIGRGLYHRLYIAPIVLQQSLNNGISIGFTVTSSGILSITILDYNKFINFIKSFIPNIHLPLPLTRTEINIPNFPSYTPLKTINSLPSNIPSSEEFTIFHEVKWGIVRNNLDISHWDRLFHLFHNNLPIFMGLVAIVFYNYLPQLDNIFSIITNRSINYVNNIINLLYRLNSRFNPINIFIINIRNFNVASMNFYSRFAGSGNRGRISNAAVINANRNRIARLYNTLFNETHNQLTHLIAYLNNEYGTFIVQDRGGHIENVGLSVPPYSFDILVQIDLVRYNQIMDLFQRINILNDTLAGYIHDIARLLGQNSSIFENVFPNEDQIDNIDLYPIIQQFVNQTGIYNIEDFEIIYNEAKTAYTRAHF